MRFDAEQLCRAWLSVAQASSTDKNDTILGRSVAVEEYPNGVRLVATNRIVMLTAWVPDLDNHYGDHEPAVDEAPDRTVIAHDPDARGKGFLTYVLSIATSEEDRPPGQIEVRVSFDVRIPAGQDADQPLDGMDPTYTVLETPDVEKVYLPTIGAAFPNWRSVADAFIGEETKAIAFNLEVLDRLAKVRRWCVGQLVWTFGGAARVAAINWPDSDPHVQGWIMPARWILPGEEPPAADDADAAPAGDPS